jgi:Ca-activated chloride channel family protein
VDEAPRAGLVAGEHAVPLLGVAVEAELKGFAARVTLSQRYRNDGAKPLEAVYVFPLDEGAAVCGFEAVVDGRVVKGTVMEREKAFEAYDDAITAGNGAYLLDEERPDVFTASIGNLPAGKEVVVRLTTVSELPSEGDALRFTLPTTVSPRYAPAEDRQGVGRTPAEALNPPVAGEVPYGLSLRVSLDMPSAIRGVESPSHPVSVDLDGPRGTVGLGTAETALDRDFVLVVRLAETHAPLVRLERTAEGGLVAMLAFAPRFGNEDALPEAPKGEVVFLVDRSGSMGGSSIAEARNALQLCLRSLPAGARFNVVGFGSTHESLFPSSRPYDDASLAEASAYVSGMKADLGGTEVLQPLRAILPAPVEGGGLRQLFLLTDGQVSNTDAVLETVRAHSATNRVFTFGIGAGASHHLVKGAARAGHGAAEMIAPGERIEPKVLRQLARALSPALEEVRVDWGGARVTQAPYEVPPVFDGGRLVVYGFLDGPAPGEVVLRAKGPRGEVSFPVHLEAGEAPEGTLLATLAARTLIRDLEEGASPLHARRGSRQERGAPRDRVKDEIVRLGVTYGLVSRETSYVAVEERTDPVTGEMELKKVPIALTSGWGGLREDFARYLCAPSASASFSVGAPRKPARPEPDVMYCAAPPPKSRFGPRCDDLEDSFSFEAPSMLRRAPDLPSVEPSARPLDLLVTLQKADGSWELDEALSAALGVPLPAFERALSKLSSKRRHLRRAAATAFALHWLETEAPGAEDEWRLLARKARAWLDASGVAPARDGTWRDFCLEVFTGA